MLKILAQSWRRLSDGPRERQALALLRVITGLLFVFQGYRKLQDSDFPIHLLEQLQQWAAQNPIAPYKAFLLQGVIPQADGFAQLVPYGEILLGTSFMLGLLVSVSSPVAVFMNLNYLLAAQHTHPAILGVNAAFILIEMTLFWGRAGHCYGLDQALPLGRTSGSSPYAKPEKGKPYGKTPKKLKAVQEALAQSKKSKKKSSKAKPF